MRTPLVVSAMLLFSACSEEETAAPAPAPSPAVEAQPAPQPAPPAPTPPVVEGPPVDLLHAVPTRVRTSTALGDSLGQIERLWDGDPESAWNSKTEDLVGAFVEVQLPADAQVTGIEMTAGFTRNQRGRDLFTGNHRIASVRVVHDEEEVGRFPLDVASQALQPLAVSGGGGTYRIEILEVVAGTQQAWREACISELRVLGRAPSAREGALQPTAVIVPASERAAMAQAFAAATGGAAPAEAIGEEAPVEGEAAPAEEGVPADGLAVDPNAGPVLVPREGLHLTELTLAAGVEDRQAVDPRITFSRASDERVYCLMRLENPERVETQLMMRWEMVENTSRGNERETRVAAQPRYVTWGYGGTRGRAGIYRCVVRDLEGNVLGSVAYELTE